MAVDPSKRPGSLGSKSRQVPEEERTPTTVETALPKPDPKAEGPDHLTQWGEGNAVTGLVRTQMDNRKTGSSAMGGTGELQRQAVREKQRREAINNNEGFLNTTKNVLDQIWMNDIKRGPFSGEEETTIGVLGNEINLGSSKYSRKAWESTVGNAAKGGAWAGDKVLDALDEITHWVNVRAGVATNNVAHWAGNELFDPMSLDEYETSGLTFGDTLMVTGVAGEVVDTTEFLETQARQQVQAKEAARQFMTGQKLKQAGYGDFEEWWIAQQGPDSPFAMEGLDQVVVPDDFKLRDAGDWDNLKRYQDEVANQMTGEDLQGRAFMGNLMGDLLIPLGPLKAPKWLRYGTKMKNGKQVFAGLTHKSTLNAKVQKAHQEAVDDFVVNGAKNAAAKEAEQVAAGGYDEIMAILNPTRGQTGSASSHMLASVLKDVKDPRQAAVVLAAARGSVKHRKMLHDDYGLLYDAVARGNKKLKTGMTSEETLALSRPVGFQMYPLVARNADGVDEIALTDDAIRAAEDQLGLMKNELYMLDDIGLVGATDIGSTSAWAKGVANAWRMGKANRDTTPTLIQRGKDAAKGKRSKIGAFGEQTTEVAAPQMRTLADGQRVYKSTSGVEELSFKLSSNMRQVKVWKWINGSRGTGFLKIKGADDYQGADEIAATLTDSKVLREDPEFIREMKDVWAKALTPDQKMRAAEKIEAAAVTRIAEKYGLDPEAAMQIFNTIRKRRSQLTERLTAVDNGRAYGFDPETGDLILAHPSLVSQLENSVPLLDMRLFEKTIKRANSKTYQHLFASGVAPTAQRFTAGMGTFADELNSLWKANVLLRFGYTQRNVVEGWMRSWAYLGMIPALMPDNMIRGAWRLGVSNRYRDVVRGVSRGSVSKLNTKLDEQLGLRKLDQKDLERTRTELVGATGQRRSTLTRHEKELDKRLKAHDQEIERIRRKADTWAQRRANNKRRRMFDEQGEAFAGRWGDLRRESAGAGDTVENFLQGRAGRAMDWERLRADDDWTIVRPGEANYWESLARAGGQFAADDLAMMALKGATETQMVRWLKTQAGSAHLKRLNVNGYTPTAEKLANRTHRMVNEYLPTRASKDLFLNNAGPTADEVQALLKGTKGLSPVHGNAVRNWWQVNKGAASLSNSVRQGVFKWLGSKPESFLVRHPFYAEVYRRQVDAMVSMYRKNGEIIDDGMIKAIEKSAHADALKATDDVMFTILRYSNPANAVKYLSPFFAAWENSMRVWSRIIAKDPFVGYAGMYLWDLPNRFGMVYDYEGKPIETDPSSFFRGTASTEEGYIFFPKPWNDAMAETFGGNIPGVPKSAINVVTPGEVPWLPGFGPGGLIPASMILSNRPDIQIELRELMGDQLYTQVAPFGVADEPSALDLLSSWQRKALQKFQGEANETYMATALATQKNMITSHMVSGAPNSEFPTYDDYRKKTDNWFTFSMLTSMLAPVATTRFSEYQMEIQAWNDMKRALPFDQAMDRFENLFGPEFVPLVVSGSQRNVKGMDYTEQAFRDIRNGKDYIERFSVGGASFASVLAAASGNGEFEVGVYHWLSENRDIATGELYIEKFTLPEMQEQIEMQSAWQKYRRERTKYDRYVELEMMTQSEADDFVRAYGRNPDGEIMSEMSEQGRKTWIAALESFENPKPAELAMIAAAVEDEDFRNSQLGSTHLWDEIEFYLDERARFKGYADLEMMTGTEAQEFFDSWKEDYQYTSLAFKNFYDAYFKNDDLNTDWAGQ